MESGGTDGFSAAAAVGIATESIRIGTAIVPVYTRPPALIAMSALTAQQASGGRFCLGLGASSPVIIERWMGLSYDRPVERIRETVAAVEKALAGEKVDVAGETITVRGFKLEHPAATRVPIFLAALGPRMLALADEIADGVALFLAAEEGVRIAAKEAPSCELVERLICFIDEDPDDARNMARWMLGPYLAVPGYNAFIARQGFEDVAERFARSWAEGDRKAAAAAITDDLVEALFVIGTAAECRERIQSFRDAGLDAPVLMPISQRGPDAVRAALEAMAGA
jgi:probable F420-dependent oxidoreductase